MRMKRLAAALMTAALCFGAAGAHAAQLVLPADLKEIEDEAFSGALALDEVVLPQGVERIGDRAFAGCTALKAVSIPAGTTELGGGVFKNCHALERIDLPDGIESIGSDAFYKCASALKIFCHAGTKTADAVTACGMYFVCEDMPDYAFVQSRDENGQAWLTLKKAFASEADVTLPQEIDGVPVKALDAAFRLWDDLKSVVIPEGYESLLRGALNSCSALERIDLPDTLKTIGGGAFVACGALVEITIPSGVTELPGSVFLECGSLERVYLPDHIESIGEDAFADCPETLQVFCRAGTATEAAVIAYGLTPTLLE